MKLLKDILNKIDIVELIGSTEIPINSIHIDSRKIESASLFVAIKGTNTDGHLFIQQAISNGAIAIVCQELPTITEKGIVFVKVKNSSFVLGYIASNFYNNPSSKLKLVGVTGTNGKTTITTLLYHLFQLLGYKVGLISTICNKINNEKNHATHTTPDALKLNLLLSDMVNKGCTHCFMEVSSHAISQDRISGLNFTGGVFTNISHDHLDYHKTFDEYLKTKKSFFDNLSSKAFALSNIDDKNGNIILQNTNAIRNTYALQSLADFKGKVIENLFSGLYLNIDGNEVWCKLVGKFNAYNLLAVFATAILLGENKITVLANLSNLRPIEGRFDYLKMPNNVIAIVDYAHTPDALLNVLNTITNIKENNERIITVIGCGGNRDTRKRPIMAKIACDESNIVILTSDNPRSENPEKIIEEMKMGIDFKDYKKVLAIVDRKEAIKTAYTLAVSGDIILIAGKGHEKYQEIKGIKYPFDDKQVLQEMLIDN